MNLFEDQAKQDIADARNITDVATAVIMPNTFIGELSCNFLPPNGSEPQRPSDKEFVKKVSVDYGLTHGQACDLILEIAERMKVSP